MLTDVTFPTKHACINLSGALPLPNSRMCGLRTFLLRDLVFLDLQGALRRAAISRKLTVVDRRSRAKRSNCVDLQDLCRFQISPIDRSARSERIDLMPSPSIPKLVPTIKERARLDQIQNRHTRSLVLCQRKLVGIDLLILSAIFLYRRLILPQQPVLIFHEIRQYRPSVSTISLSLSFSRRCNCINTVGYSETERKTVGVNSRAELVDGAANPADEIIFREFPGMTFGSNFLPCAKLTFEFSVWGMAS